MKVKEYMISVYAVLVKNSKRDIESLPEESSSPSPSIWRRRRKALSSRRSNAPGTPTEGP